MSYALSRNSASRFSSCEPHPACDGDVDRLEHALHAVFVLQTECDHLELQLADRAEDQIVVAQRLEQLRGAFLAKLREAFLQGLHAQRILEHGAAEDLRREIRHAREGEILAFGEGVADVDGAVIVQTDDIAGVGLLGLTAIGGEKGQRIGNADVLVEAHVMQAHAARVAAGTQAHERDAVAVPGIHVGLDLEDESRELRLLGADHALQRRRAAAAPANA